MVLPLRVYVIFASSTLLSQTWLVLNILRQHNYRAMDRYWLISPFIFLLSIHLDMIWGLCHMAVDEVFPELSLTIHSAISSWVSMSLNLLFPQTDRDESGFQGVCGFTLMVYRDIESYRSCCSSFSRKSHPEILVYSLV